MDTTKTDRYNKGREKLKEIDGEAGERVIESLKDISPDLARYIIEYPFGDVYSRETTLDNVGATSDEISEVMILMSVYAGFPSALNGTLALKEVLKARAGEKLHIPLYSLPAFRCKVYHPFH